MQLHFNSEVEISVDPFRVFLVINPPDLHLAISSLYVGVVVIFSKHPFVQLRIYSFVVSQFNVTRLLTTTAIVVFELSV